MARRMRWPVRSWNAQASKIALTRSAMTGRAARHPVLDRLGGFQDGVGGGLRRLHHRFQLDAAVARAGRRRGNELRDLLVDAGDLARQARLAHVVQFHAGVQLGAQLGDPAVEEAAQLRQPGVQLRPQCGAKGGRIRAGGESERIHAPLIRSRGLPFR
jgi:hypothetical protein